jgi:hypothetical protein
MEGEQRRRQRKFFENGAGTWDNIEEHVLRHIGVTEADE